ncbi:MAG: MBL fold metallo-hydrolase [Acidobacteria bacterium]|nr:MBL fold metallo-hydrolase [Acidobacteriota bacterium]
MGTTTRRAARAASKATLSEAGAAKRRAAQVARAGGADNQRGALPGVRVRMFRQGLGDAFLLTFDPGGAEAHVLVDFGTLGATTTGVSMSTTAADIAATSGGRLDAVVVTHEHWDHISGFRSCAETFAAMDVGQVWLAWTENPDDPLARTLASSRRDLGAALAMTVATLTTRHDRAATALGRALRDVLAFSGGVPEGSPLAFGERLDDTMHGVRTALGRETHYLLPGQPVLEPAFAPGFRIYVLGPPRDADAIDDLGHAGDDALYAVRAARSGAAAPPPDGSPFDTRFRLPLDAATTRDVLAGYLAPREQWRQIPRHWMRSARDLALQLDNATNNTSLVLAIERVADGKVLLFPGDAQLGSWQSWHDPALSWTVAGARGPKTVTAGDLLRRTVFYKVGHHASHNATARQAGLELMAADGLVAFVPVDRRVALGRHPKGSWRMPARALARRLLERCRGRVVRSDIGWMANSGAAVDETEAELAGLGSSAEWSRWRTAQRRATHVRVEPRWVDYLLR